MQRIALDRVNNWVLTKQHLIPTSHTQDVLQIVRDVGGLHATSATTPYLSLLARHPTFRRQMLDEGLYHRPALARIRCVRKTIYILPREWLPAAYAATAEMVQRASRAYLERRGVSAATCARLSQAILDLLQDQELTAREIRDTLQTDLDVSATLYLMCDEGLLLRGRPVRNWKDKSRRYGRFDAYFPDVCLGQMDPRAGTVSLIHRYLRAFGPASEDDAVWWTGLGKRKVRQALRDLGDAVTAIEIDTLEGPFLILAEELEEMRAARLSSTPVVSLLPELDPYPMGYKGRQRYLPPQHREYVFDRSGNIAPTIMVDGQVVGVWDYIGAAGSEVRFRLLDAVTEEIKRHIIDGLRRCGELFREQDVRVVERLSMAPLSQRTAGSFMSPLKQMPRSAD